MNARNWAAGHVFAIIFAAGWITAGLAPNAPAYQPKAPAAPSPAEAPQPAASVAIAGQFAPAERSMLLMFSRAQRLMDQARLGEAAQCLGRILNGPDDYFFRPDASSPVHRSLKAEAARMIGRMPQEGRELYELEFGSIAGRLLEEAVTAGDADGLAEVSRRFFHTRSGSEATLLLGFHHLDHGRPVAAALTFKRLWESSPAAEQYEPTLSLALATCWLRAGEPEQARYVLEGLQSGYPRAIVQIAGEETLLGDHKDDLVSWLAGVLGPAPMAAGPRTDQWSMLRGNAARNAAGTGSGPLLTMRWRVPTTDYPEVESMIVELRRDYAREDVQLIPSFHPLAVDDILLMRTVTKLQAVDLETGKRVWEVPADDPFDESLEPGGGVVAGLKARLESAVRMRMWADATFGTLSSDGKYVFAVEDLKLEYGTGNRRQFVNPMRQANAVGLSLFNRLAAYEIRTGKLIWHLGGSAQELALPQAGAFFLGPPLPLMGNLYVLAELNGEIRLLALDAGSGDLLWDQQLTVVSRDVLNDPLRRLAGVSPSYADGILVCPTSDKSVVAMELTTRSLLWGYIHSTSESQSRRQRMFMAPGQPHTADSAGRWIDSSAVLADGRVLVTPVKSDELHCLDLTDGHLLWKQNRNDDLYLGCVHDGKAVLVGRRGVRAIELEDGSEAWGGDSVEFPQGSSLAGVGFRSLNRYYVPLDSAIVLEIDLDTGRHVETFESREDAVPGNLICYKDKIISQRADGVEAFHQLDRLRERVDERLAADADDAEALTLSGEILWNDGRLSDAVESFQRAWQLSPSIHTRGAFRQALFEGLREEFAAYRGRLDEIAPLIDDVSQQAVLLRLVAVGLEKEGEYEEALGRYRELIELDDGRSMEPIGDGLSLRRDRWIRVQMAALRLKMPPESQDQIDRFARDRLGVAIGKGTPQAIRGFLEYFDGQPVAQEARDTLGGLLKEEERLLELELLLERQADSNASQSAGEALAKLAEILSNADRYRDAAICYNRLAQEFGDVVCLDGKTGEELWRGVSADDPVFARLDPKSPWPLGKVELKESIPKPTSVTSYGNMVVDYRGGRGPFFDDTSIELHQTPLQLVARDGLGDVRWRLPMDTITPREHLAYGRAVMHIDVLGHLLLLSMGSKILAIDTLDVSQGGTPNVIWSQDLKMPDAAAIRRQQFRRQLANLPGGLGRFAVGGGIYPAFNGPAAVSRQAVCYKRFRSLVAVDPLSGEEIWIRHDVHPDSVVFGDHEHVFVVGPDKTDADVFCVADGQKLGSRTVPPETERIATVGRRVLAWHVEGHRATIRLIDPWQEKAPKRSVWISDQLDSNSRMFMLPDEAVAVYEPDGHFMILDLADGHPIVDRQLLPEDDLAEIFVLRSPDQYLLITHRQQMTSGTTRRTYMHPTSSVRIGRGRVYAFDRTGKEMWPEPVLVENQFLSLNQPSSLPVLVFACMVQEPQTGNVRTQPKTAILCLDKRTGRVICKREFADRTSIFQVSGDPDKRTVEIRIQKNLLTMTFTDHPVPPDDDPASADNPDQNEDSSVVDTLLGAFKKAVLGGAADETEDDQPPTKPDEPGPESGAEGKDGPGKPKPTEQPTLPPAPQAKGE